MIGTLANTGAIVVGSLVGVLVHSRLSSKVVNVVFQGVGLVTLVIGISMSLHAKDLILIIVSIVLGAIIGQAINIEKHMHRFSNYVQQKGQIWTKQKDQNTKQRFTEGFVTASVLFCVGSMSILGAIEDGMGKTPSLLYAKSVIDGISSIAFASSFGISILFSSIPVLVYQGGLTFLATYLMRYMSESMTENMTAVGGILLIGLAISILKIKEINVTNMLPALVIVVILSYFF